MNDADRAKQINGAVHFRTRTLTALCRCFSMGRQRLTPDPDRVTCDRCKKLLAGRAKAAPMAREAGDVR